MGRKTKRDRPQPQADEEQQPEEEQTPPMTPKSKRVRSQSQVDEQQPDEEQLKLADEQQQEEQDGDGDGDGDGDESDTDSKDNSPIVKESNKSGAKTDEEEKAAAVVAEEDEKKPPIISNRLWSSDDEITVLQSVIDFKQEFNKDATSATNADAFFNFVKDKFHYSNFSKSQVRDKLRKLKIRYKKSSVKSKDSRSSNPHDLKFYELSNTIWGNLDANKKAEAAASDHVGAEKRVVKDESKGRLEKVALKPKEKENDFGSLYPDLIKVGFEGEISLHNITLLDDFKRYLGKVDSQLLEEWDEKWKNVRRAETRAYVNRLALVHEQTTWFYNQIKSSKY